MCDMDPLLHPTPPHNPCQPLCCLPAGLTPHPPVLYKATPTLSPAHTSDLLVMCKVPHTLTQPSPLCILQPPPCATGLLIHHSSQAGRQPAAQGEAGNVSPVWSWPLASGASWTPDLALLMELPRVRPYWVCGPYLCRRGASTGRPGAYTAAALFFSVHKPEPWGQRPLVPPQVPVCRPWPRPTKPCKEEAHTTLLRGAEDVVEDIASF